MSNTTVAEDPLSLQSAMRSFIADAITPISAFLALAQPGRSCLLESVEGTDRISRYSFIGIDYLESRVFDRDPDMLAGIRAVVYRRALPLATRNLVIGHPTLGEWSGTSGGIVLGIEHVLTPDALAVSVAHHRHRRA